MHPACRHRQGATCTQPCTGRGPHAPSLQAQAGGHMHPALYRQGATCTQPCRSMLHPVLHPVLHPSLHRSVPCALHCTKPGRNDYVRHAHAVLLCTQCWSTPCIACTYALYRCVCWAALVCVLGCTGMCAGLHRYVQQAWDLLVKSSPPRWVSPAVAFTCPRGVRISQGLA